MKAAICLQCGYNFTPGAKQPETLIGQHPEILETPPPKNNAKAKFQPMTKSGFMISLASWLKKSFVFGVILIILFIIGSFFYKDSRYTLTIIYGRTGNEWEEKYWRKYIGNSENWQKYFRQKSQNSSKPYVAIKINEDYYYGKGPHARRTPQSKIEIIEPKTGKILCKGEVRYSTVDEFKSKAPAEINSLAEKCLAKR